MHSQRYSTGDLRCLRVLNRQILYDLRDCCIHVILPMQKDLTEIRTYIGEIVELAVADSEHKGLATT